MFRGGYKIIDLKDAQLTVETPQAIDGIYESIESNYRKAIMLSNITLAGIKHANTFVEVTTSGSNLVISVYGYTLTITEDDVVTIAAI